MAQNPWVAVDAATIPAKRARELRDAWEDFVDGRSLDDAEDPGTPQIRVPIADSWQRSLDAGVDPERPPARAVARRAAGRAHDVGRAPARGRGRAHRRVHGHRLRRCRPPHRRQRRGRTAAEHPRRRAPAQPGGRRHELRRGRALERGGRGNQRRRHCAGRRSRRAGLRRGALHRAGPALDVRGGAGDRPRHRARCSASSTSPATWPACTRTACRSSSPRRARSRSCCSAACASATTACERATEGCRDRSRPAPRSVTRSGRVLLDPKQHWSAGRRRGDPRRRRPADPALRARRDRRADRRRRRLRRAPAHASRRAWRARRSSCGCSAASRQTSDSMAGRCTFAAGTWSC